MSKQPTLRESMATVVERTQNIQEDIKEIKDSVTGPDGCQRNHQGRISTLEGRWQGNTFNKKQKAAGGIGAVALIAAVAKILEILGWV